MLVSDEVIKLVSTNGKVVGYFLGDVFEVMLGFDVGT